MDIWEAVFLGALQGLTEFLPVSSSGHLELAKIFFHIKFEENLFFTVALHGATALAILFFFKRKIFQLVRSPFDAWKQRRMTDDFYYLTALLLSAFPVFVIGFFFKGWVESFFTGDSRMIGGALIFTAVLLFASHFLHKNQHKKEHKGERSGWQQEVTFLKALIIGIFQAISVIPGISRSGATVSSALVLNLSRSEAARFSFLMVLIPILGANFIEMINVFYSQSAESFSLSPVVFAVGIITAFFSGLVALKIMLKAVISDKLYLFGIYCLIAGGFALKNFSL